MCQTVVLKWHQCFVPRLYTTKKLGWGEQRTEGGGGGEGSRTLWERLVSFTWKSIISLCSASWILAAGFSFSFFLNVFSLFPSPPRCLLRRMCAWSGCAHVISQDPVVGFGIFPKRLGLPLETRTFTREGCCISRAGKQEAGEHTLQANAVACIQAPARWKLLGMIKWLWT